jgi:hypothetical protein
VIVVVSFRDRPPQVIRGVVTLVSGTAQGVFHFVTIRGDNHWLPVNNVARLDLYENDGEDIGVHPSAHPARDIASRVGTRRSFSVCSFPAAYSSGSSLSPLNQVKQPITASHAGKDTAERFKRDA